MARACRSLGYSESSLPYFSTRYTRIALDSHNMNSPSTNVGTVCWGLIDKNSGVKFSFSSKFRGFIIRLRPRAFANIKTLAQGGETENKFCFYFGQQLILISYLVRSKGHTYFLVLLKQNELFLSIFDHELRTRLEISEKILKQI